MAGERIAVLVCGICGIVSSGMNSVADARDQIGRMLDAIRHRGPDGQGLSVDGPVALGHARLSIIDLEGGWQPLFNEDRSVAVVANGEIYNYRELRTDLMQRGHQFRTGSDCETIAHLWEEHREGCVSLLRGMFAFVVYDRRDGTLFGARDRFGQKPLFYSADSHRFAFASEIKSLLALNDVPRTIDLTSLDQFLFRQYVPHPETIYSHVQALPPGHYFVANVSHLGAILSTEASGRTFRRNSSASPWEAVSPRDIGPAQDTGKRTKSAANDSAWERSPNEDQDHNQNIPIIRSYWQPSFDVDETRSESDHLDEVERHLADAVQSHLVSDVPVGLFLSGGIDSCLVAALARQPQSSAGSSTEMQSFCVTFPGSSMDEGAYAREAAAHFQTRHREYPLSPAEMIATLKSAADIFDQPLADTAVIPLLFLSRHAADHVKVVLTGDGGDELFAGYRKYQRAARWPGSSPMWQGLLKSMVGESSLTRLASDPWNLRRLRARLGLITLPAMGSSYNRRGWEAWDRLDLYQPHIRDSLRQQAANQHGLSHEHRSFFKRVSAEADGSTSSRDRLSPLNEMLLLDQSSNLPDDLLLKSDHAMMAAGLEGRAPLLDHLLAETAGRLPLSLKATRSQTKVALRRIAEKYLPPSLTQRRKKGFTIPLGDWLRTDLAEWLHEQLGPSSASVPLFFDRSVVERTIREHTSGRRDHASRLSMLLVIEQWQRRWQGDL